MQNLIGRTLDHYRIVEKIGEGGMGEVYRARDERLDRDVAIKVLPPEVAGIDDRLQRFEREAKLLASLKHPNIATLHGLEEDEGTRFLVMELVEGESLATMIARSALPVDDVAPIAIEIARALEAAHDHGVIHRDLKPANVMVDPDGHVKVLDFGLAKAFDPSDSPQQSPESIAELPTITADLTRGGVLLGTTAYMSPEHARGKPVDKRTDIWAFGCTVFEMLAGSRPFRGASSTEILAAVIKEDPDWEVISAEVPPPIRRLLARCLTKDPRNRLHDIADARIVLQSLSGVGEHQADRVPPAIGRGLRLQPWTLLVALSASVGIGWLAAGILNPGTEPSRSVPRVTRFDLNIPENHRLMSDHRDSVALSTDGSQLVYPSNGRLYLHQLESATTKPIPGTDGFQSTARNPIFSPDGDFVVFWADEQLRKITLKGGAPVSLCDIGQPLGLSWGFDGRILIGRGSQGIWTVPETGGPAEQLISVDSENLEEAYGPQLLPDGDHVLYTLNTGLRGWENAQIIVQSLETGDRKLLIEGGAEARFVASGHLVFAQGNSLFAVPFDSGELEVVGDSVPLSEKVWWWPYPFPADVFAVSKTGTLAYRPQSKKGPFHIVWVDREGLATRAVEAAGYFGYLSLSPDGRRVAVAVDQGKTREIWIYDLEGGRPPFPIRRGGCSWDPVWTPDGRQVIFAFAEYPTTTENLFLFSVDVGNFEPELLLSRPGQQFPYAISADGHDLFFFDRGGPGGGFDVWVLDMTGDADPHPLFDSKFAEVVATTSPDMRRIAYTSNQSGKDEVWVASYPDLNQRQLISSNGGFEPRWSHDGSELYYWSSNAMMAASVTSNEKAFRFSAPRWLFKGNFWAPFDGGWPSYGVAPDGRFLLIQKADEGSGDRNADQIRIVLNWFEELKRLAPVD